MSDIDIRAILNEWPYEPDQNIRMVRFSDGRSLLQVRLPMGLEQYEVKGRPDGKRPHDADSALAFQEARLEKAKAEGTDASFRLDHAACEELYEESTLYYLRYFRFMEIEDWDRTRADTSHNLRLFDLVARYAEQPGDRLHLEQWRPYLLRVHALAGAMIQMKKKRPAKAIQMLREAIDTVRALPDLEDETFGDERQQAMDELKSLLKRIRAEVPPSPADLLEKELREAIRAEEYERAAVLRDKIDALKSREK